MSSLTGFILSEVSSRVADWCQRKGKLWIITFYDQRCWRICTSFFLYPHLGASYQRFLEEMKDGTRSVSEEVR